MVLKYKLWIHYSYKLKQTKKRTPSSITKYSENAHTITLYICENSFKFQLKLVKLVLIATVKIMLYVQIVFFVCHHKKNKLLNHT